ncbi:glycosyltransferase family 4 protein [Bacillus paranthracis]|uniref:glycosyltransferase family 4 protein n=1 Tax=Bacillus TaxID=1386 RepID=UPI0022E61C63|nr:MULTISPECIES: glycosyltransferase family 4 protein [Bacillus cereus group]MDA1745333.1 glycosyltransferase family 4 protein [Bacillus cereus group sp. LD121LC]MDK7421069.1 glycosyltransferase family 4 protein [Bacillus paranthracis]MDK7431652.1 glycosyltransferase family 4 protein [Bacillus paranthracis]MDK7517550.1 glycosyltransferase family 4 protein [Bacillus paranthracis]MDK7574081.1 glycosyltransferase family 4 protein [Bacillus paranthracis]
MKVLIYDAYAKSSPKGGSTISLIDFLRMRKETGIEYYFLTNELNKQYYDKYISHLGVQEIYMSFPKGLFRYGKVYEKNIFSRLSLMLFTMPLFSIKLAYLLRKKKIDKVIGNELRASLTIGLGTCIANRELITFVRSDYGLNSKMSKLILNISSKIICISKGIYELLEGQRRNKAKIINESIEIDTSLSKNKSNRETINIVNIANISPYKNQLTLVKAMKEVIKEYRDVKLYIVGDKVDDKCLSEMLNYIDENHLNDFVSFTGFQSDVKKYLSLCDIYVQPSLNEGLGRTIIEAYLFKVPVIGSSIPGIQSIVENEFNGLLFEPSNHMELSKKIIELIHDKDKRILLGQNGRELIEEEFNLEKNVEQIESFLQK